MKHVNFHFYRFCFAKIMDLFLSTAIFIKKLSFDFFIPLLFKYCATSIYLLKMPISSLVLKYVSYVPGMLFYRFISENLTSFLNEEEKL